MKLTLTHVTETIAEDDDGNRWVLDRDRWRPARTGDLLPREHGAYRAGDHICLPPWVNPMEHDPGRAMRQWVRMWNNEIARRRARAEGSLLKALSRREG